MSTHGAIYWSNLPCHGGDPRSIPTELNAAYELRIRVERRDRLARMARRYLDAHCDRTGRRIEGGMTVEEYAYWVGTCAQVLSKAVTRERKRNARRDVDARSRTTHTQATRAPRQG
jgi:hypothetical protein